MALNGNVPRKHAHQLSSRRVLSPTFFLGVALVVMFAVYVLLGSYTVTIPDFFTIVINHLTGGEKIPGASFIVMEHKLPRAVVGTMIGIAFGLAGALFQTMLRNPLASPDIIGISYGASAAAVTAIVIFGASGAVVSWAALGGALGVAAIIYAISRGAGSGGGSRGNAAGNRLILAGVGIAAALHAVVNFLMTRADIRTAADVLVWLNGSLNSATWERAGILTVSLLVLVPAVTILAGPLRILELGDDAAAGLGIRVNATRLGLVLTAVGLAAVATAAAGPVAFVAFLAGPIARRIVRKPSLPASALTGALIVLAADFFASNIAPVILDGTVLPVGVITGALGAPFLLWLLVTSNRKEA
ncbi:FecCD family ABC transporter permease [Paenarthrobacter aromaticivorans]|uniref:Iron chelate uptake ABC transporter family permease subunit n=2 Tax=Paenarthrobacter TaxID=1742992 RepID=A0ABS6ICE6_9MICC|nr:iron chelate uptake ABC transporter family permease subunit [Paenarthrobacter sp. MMS21-TAE1-1]MBU8869095.1 iron chelate uptake ABC transporter family permease subunit [Paenarthrobacter sp. MMS21-TAE1-1]